MTPTKVQGGDRIKITFQCRLDDGQVVMSSDDSGEYEFTAGSDQIFPKVSEATIGMTLNETKTISLKPEDAFGKVDKGLVREIDNHTIPPEVKDGDMIEVESQDGEKSEWLVVKRSGDKAVIDANHPLAGIPIQFEFSISHITKLAN